MTYASAMASFIKNSGIILIFVFLLTFSSSVTSSPTDVEHQFAKASNKFAAAIYQKIIETESGNVVISPVSIETALALAMIGATGKTRQEMQSGLKYPATYGNDVIAENFETFIESVRLSKGVSIANKIFLMKNLTVRKSFNDVAAKSFVSEAQNLDFSESAQSAATINEWVEEHTSNKIKNLIADDALNSDTRMVIVNALYFKGFWTTPFDYTFQAPFYINEQDSVKTEFMYIEENYKYGSLPYLNATAIALPYEDSNMYMLIILPNSRTGLSELESKLHNVNLGNVVQKLDKQTNFVTIPKFKIELDINLNEPLKKLGMHEMFEDTAEFNNLLEITQSMKVSEVLHKVVIEVNEDGTEAAAATSFKTSWDSDMVIENPIRFTADHPFLFALFDSETKRSFFMGRVAEF